MKKKYDWKNMEYKDYPFINLLGKQSQLKKYIRGRTEKMDDIDKQIEKLKNKKIEHKVKISSWNRDLKEVNRVIGERTKIEKSDDSITLVKNDKYIRGKVRLYGDNKWVHIGSNDKFGKVNQYKKIGEMSDEELCEEFRYKFGIMVGGSKTRFYSDNFMNKRRKKQIEKQELRKEFRQKEKDGKIDYYTEGGTDTKSTTTSKGMSKQRQRRYK